VSRLIRAVLGALLAVALGLAGFASGATLAPARADESRIAVHLREWEISATPETATTGTVVFTVINDGVFPHDFSIAGHTTRPLNGGESTTLTVVFSQSGTYTYNSTVDDVDREMWGAITVTGPPLATTPTTSTRAAPTLPLRLVADLALPGRTSRFDYESVDAHRRRLYIAHLGDGNVIAFDTARRRIIRSVPGVAGVHGVLAVQALDRVFATATDAHQLVTISPEHLTIVGRTPAGSFPDGLDYEPLHRRIFVSDMTGQSEVVVDARGRRVRTIPLGGEAGNVRYDAGSRRMLVAVAGKEQLAAIDPGRLRVVSRTHLAGCEGSHGVYVDSARRLAFVACEDNAQLVVVDLRSGRATSRFPVGDGPDVLAFDASLGRLYVAAESGVVSVFAERGRSLRQLGRDELAPHAHSVAVDPTTHLVYFPLEDVDGRPVLRIMRPV
jgi:DNA-binding beta-propeller fold protein YncE